MLESDRRGHVSASQDDAHVPARSYERLRTLGQLGDAVKDARRRAGITQAQLAAAAGTSQPRIARLEAGKLNATHETISRVFGALGYDIAALARNRTRPW